MTVLKFFSWLTSRFSASTWLLTLLTFSSSFLEKCNKLGRVNQTENVLYGFQELKSGLIARHSILLVKSNFLRRPVEFSLCHIFLQKPFCCSGFALCILLVLCASTKRFHDDFMVEVHSFICSGCYQLIFSYQLSYQLCFK